MAQTSSRQADSELIRHAQAGNLEALGALFEGFTEYLMGLARARSARLLRAKVDPADIVQETFLSAYRQFTQFRGTTECQALVWLQRIFDGQLALHLRRYLGTRQRDVRLERQVLLRFENSTEDADLVAREVGPIETLSRKEQARLLDLALQRLPEMHREVVVRRYLHGHSFGRIAIDLERTEDSVQKLWARAMAQLRSELSQHHP